ncbi:hypothetical protein IU11_02975 [Cellulosimicrobium sp. MM]|nr:hypothetical protein [Cellulosimicrobium sp. MM]KFD44384.1 hypothetical protein IU11_02975 [Cellulosimicrobium sp. MM]
MTTDHGDAVHDGAVGEPDEPSLGAAETLRLIREQQERARQATEPDSRLLFLAWGVAWLVGYLCLWTSAVRVADGTATVRVTSGAGQSWAPSPSRGPSGSSSASSRPPSRSRSSTASRAPPGRAA